MRKDVEALADRVVAAAAYFAKLRKLKADAQVQTLEELQYGGATEARALFDALPDVDLARWAIALAAEDDTTD